MPCNVVNGTACVLEVNSGLAPNLICAAKFSIEFLRKAVAPPLNIELTGPVGANLP